MRLQAKSWGVVDFVVDAVQKGATGRTQKSLTA
jgi:hypothetical protein